MKGPSIDLAARIADLICQADELIMRGYSSARASRTLGVPPSTMRYWRKKTGCPEPQYSYAASLEWLDLESRAAQAEQAS
jgi:transposase-like protein